MYDSRRNTIGDSSSRAIAAPHNAVTRDGYWMQGACRTPEVLFNLALNTSKTIPAFFNGDRPYNDYGFLYLQDRADRFNKRLVITPGAAEQLFRTAF